MSTDTKSTGTVVWFSFSKGFGFIQPLNTIGREDQLFVHYRDIQCEGFKTLLEGEAVEYGVEDTLKGQKAVNVRSLSVPT